jgi:hypothetical protein
MTKVVDGRSTRLPLWRKARASLVQPCKDHPSLFLRFRQPLPSLRRKGLSYSRKPDAFLPKLPAWEAFGSLNDPNLLRYLPFLALAIAGPLLRFAAVAKRLSQARAMPLIEQRCRQSDQRQLNSSIELRNVGCLPGTVLIVKAGAGVICHRLDLLEGAAIL